jgi:hypothetical protein
METPSGQGPVVAPLGERHCRAAPRSGTHANRRSRNPYTHRGHANLQGADPRFVGDEEEVGMPQHKRDARHAASRRRNVRIGLDNASALTESPAKSEPERADEPHESYSKGFRSLLFAEVERARISICVMTISSRPSTVARHSADTRREVFAPSLKTSVVGCCRVVSSIVVMVVSVTPTADAANGAEANRGQRFECRPRGNAPGTAPSGSRIILLSKSERTGSWTDAATHLAGSASAGFW